MGDLRIDHTKNRLYLSFAGADRDDIAATVAEIVAVARRMPPGFTCLADLRGSGRLLVTHRDLFVRAQGALAEAGMRRVVRILSPRQREDPAFKVLDIVGPGYLAEYATRLRDGDRLLDRFQRERTRRRRREENAGFRVVAPGGWRDDETSTDFYEALRRLERIRRDGRPDALVVDAGYRPLDKRRTRLPGGARAG